MQAAQPLGEVDAVDDIAVIKALMMQEPLRGEEVATTPEGCSNGKSPNIPDEDRQGSSPWLRAPSSDSRTGAIRIGQQFQAILPALLPRSRAAQPPGKPTPTAR